jgi:hypothetical protein
MADEVGNKLHGYSSRVSVASDPDRPTLKHPKLMEVGIRTSLVSFPDARDRALNHVTVAVLAVPAWTLSADRFVFSIRNRLAGVDVGTEDPRLQHAASLLVHARPIDAGDDHHDWLAIEH